MLFYMVTGYSETSEGEALASALGRSMSFGDDAESIHILILGIAKAGDGWQVTIKVVVEPRIRPDVSPVEPEKALKPRAEYNREEEDSAKLIHFYVLAQTSSLLAEFLAEQATRPYVHVMEEGPLWREAISFFPDIAFYEAVHANDFKIYKADHPEARLEMNQYVSHLKRLRADGGLELEG